ncbi:MAG TPA: hypothetical protein PLD47_10710 [Aggregatilineales bacterium]|nr:hypothetical protein [Anaerolineales bacterium]HRE48185.1 hypothetical protein [Aggregatilineales bacterium]
MILQRLMVISVLFWAMVGSNLPTRAQNSDCDGLPESRLADGGMALVVGSNSPFIPGAYLKPDPAIQAPVLRYLPMGTVLTVSGEFTCTFEGGRWWQGQLGDLKGWIAESVGVDYVLEPFTGEVPTPLPSTILPLLRCIQPNVSPLPTAIPEGETVSGGTFRAIFAGADGSLSYSDNFGPPRIVAQFNPPPLSVDLAPDGTAALVTTYNGIYWVELLTGQMALMADATTFALEQDAYPRRVTWIPGTNIAGVEIEDIRDDEYSYPIFSLPLDGLTQPFRVDRGNQPRDGVRRNTQRTSVVLLSANDMVKYPATETDEPPALLEFVPKLGIGDIRAMLPPAISWATDGKGFYTYIPYAEETPPNDPIAGRLWFVPLIGQPQNMGVPPEISADDYVIPSPDGKMLLVGVGSRWRIQNPASGQVIQTLPPVQYLFNWTPDSKGIVYTTPDTRVAYLGINGDSRSDFVPPAADNLYEIQWLADGTVLYAVRGRDEQLSFSVQPPGKAPIFMGLVSTVTAFSAAYLPTAPGLGKVPKACQ